MSELPVYAPPSIPSGAATMATTGTFKLLKGELREQAFDPERVDGDEIYVRMPRSKEYVCLNTGLYQKIATSDAGF